MTTRARAGRAIVVVLAVLVSACTETNTASSEDREAVGAAVVAAGEGVGLVLPTAGVTCLTERLADDAVAEVLAVEATSWSDETGAAVAAELVDCVGSTALMAAELEALMPELTMPSVQCVSERLDPTVVEQVIDAALRQRPRNGPEVEVELSVALGVCLSPAELLDL